MVNNKIGCSSKFANVYDVIKKDEFLRNIYRVVLGDVSIRYDDVFFRMHHDRVIVFYVEHFNSRSYYDTFDIINGEISYSTTFYASDK